jgi:hypothetical protein
MQRMSALGCPETEEEARILVSHRKTTIYAFLCIYYDLIWLYIYSAEPLFGNHNLRDFLHLLRFGDIVTIMFLFVQ